MLPEPTTSEAPRPSRGARLALIALVALASSGLLAACGSSKSSSGSSTAKLDTARVARSIEQSILAQKHLPSKVNCPSGVPQEQGRTFECIAITKAVKKPHNPVRTRFVVTIQNSRGYVTYEGK
jgi:hypothetical protein